jgi:hypothetical protein
MDWWRCPESHRRIEIVFPLQGSIAAKRWYARFHADSVAHFEMFDIRTCLYDDSTCFVAKYHGFFYNKIPDASMKVIVDIATAYADFFNGDSDICRGKLFIDREIFNGQIVFSLNTRAFIVFSKYARKLLPSFKQGYSIFRTKSKKCQGKIAKKY